MLKFSEIFEFSKEKFRKIPILKEFEWFEWFEWIEWFEWFGPSPIEPFNSGLRLLREGVLVRKLLLRRRVLRGAGDLGRLRLPLALGPHAGRRQGD